MKLMNHAWKAAALLAGALLLTTGLAPAGAAEKKAAATGDAATSQPGITVTGQVKIAGDVAGVSLADCEGILVATAPKPPQKVIKQGREGVQKWVQEWLKTPEGQAYSKLMRLRKPVTIDQDGRFQVSDVPQGKFTLLIAAFKTETPEGAAGQPAKKVKTELLAQTKHEFEVARQQAGAGKPLDLGTVELTVPKVPQAGDMAPDFKVPTLDNKTISLKDYRGKVVLLDFWATWCGPCRGEVPNLKSAYEKFGKNPKFVIISLSLDDDIAAPKDYVKKNGMDWTQGFLGDWGQDKVTKAYGVNSIPATFLIGPDGKVIDKGLRGESLAPGIAKALDAKEGAGKEAHSANEGQGGKAEGKAKGETKGETNGKTEK
jgi:peroxiredoxin